MEPGEHLHIIGLGDTDDWKAGRGSIYYIEDGRGKIVLPVFTTPERARKHALTLHDSPESYMQMLESLGATAESHATPLTEGWFIVMPLDSRTMATAAATVRADYLVRDLRPGEEQEVLRLEE
jgi:hypothetical protein